MIVEEGKSICDPGDCEKARDYYKDPYSIRQDIEVVIKALGTMVVEPVYETNPDNFIKQPVGSIQRPILQDKDRETVEKKLIELISTL